MHTPSLRAAAAALALAAPGLGQQVLYATDFDDASGWTFSNTSPWGPNGAHWHVDALPATPMAPYVSAPASLNFNGGAVGIDWGWWRGHAQSPEVDLSQAAGPVRLTFEYAYWHETHCEWDAFTVQVVDAANPALVRFEECLSFTNHAFGVWRHFDLPLDPAWGRVRVRFGHDTLDDWNFLDQGSFVDDLRILVDCGWSVECEGQPQSGGAPGADLAAAGSTSIAAGDLRLVGAGFPPHTFAAAFAGPDRAALVLGNGVRCVGLGTSVRLGVAPTRDQGAPVWNLDLGAFPLLQLAVAGQPLFAQTIYRDGASFNLSDALRLVICP